MTVEFKVGKIYTSASNKQNNNEPVVPPPPPPPPTTAVIQPPARIALSKIYYIALNIRPHGLMSLTLDSWFPGEN
jgi:hypothetical protein